jgi:hypothetical protein
LVTTKVATAAENTHGGAAGSGGNNSTTATATPPAATAGLKTSNKKKKGQKDEGNAGSTLPQPMPSAACKLTRNAEGEPVGAAQLLTLANIPPNMYSMLIEASPVIAYEIIANLLRSNESVSEKYLGALITMETSLQTMEVVNRLTTPRATTTGTPTTAWSASVSSSSPSATAAPPADGVSSCVGTGNTGGSSNDSQEGIDPVPVEFVQAYISNCIKCCGAQKDKYMQNRLVRLVCAFLVSIVRNGLVDIRGSYSEALAFCIEFSKIKEAAALFRMLNKAAEAR